ncbi:MAG: hypothetical protein U1E10_07955 [Bdellovibrionales bacterium]|nr:hypothetical protein [Bdellovibrionales bacterium]
MSQNKNLLSLFVLVAISVLGLEGSYGATANLQIATEYAIDPNTGTKAPVALNPSGTIDLTYINNGIVLQYDGRDGKSHAIKVHLDFEFLLNSDPGSRAMAVAIYDKIKEAGPSATGKAIGQMAERAKAEGQVLTLMVEAFRNPGFYKTDFDLAQIRMVTSGGENVRLQNLVAATFMPAQNAEPPVSTTEAKADSLPASVKTCEGQFVSAATPM